MADRPGTQVDDLSLAIQIMDGDREGLRTLIRAHGPQVKGFLKARFVGLLDEFELDDAFCRTLEKVWKYAHNFDDKKGSMAAWLIAIARKCALSILEEKRPRETEYDPAFDDPGEECPFLRTVEEDEDDDPRETQRLLKDLESAISELPRLQQAIIRADLACPSGKADSQRLADQHGSTKNSIEVSRNKARAAIELELRKRGHFQNQQRSQS